LKLNLKVVIVLTIVGVGIAGYYYYRESQKKPEFNVFDLKVETYVAYVYVQNMGTADAHDLMILLYGRDTPEPYAYENLSVNGSGSRLEILRAGQIEKVKISLNRELLDRLINWESFRNRIIDYLVVVRSAEGVQNEFYFER